MAQKLNKKLVGLLVASAMVLMTVTGIVLLNNLPDQDPTKYAADGDKFMAQGEYQKAAQSFHRAYAKDPAQSPDYLVKAAKCIIELGEIGKARPLIQMAKTRDGRHKQALETELEIEFEIAPYIGTVNQWYKVVECAKAMLELEEFSGSARVHFVLGRAYLELRKEDATFDSKGESHLKRALELDPTNVEALTLLADKMSRTAMELEADRQLEEARATRAGRTGLIAAAIEKAKASGDTERLAELDELRARCLLMDGEIAEGERLLRDLAAKETTRNRARLMLGRMLAGASRFKTNRNLEEALSVLKSAHEANLKDIEPYFALNNTYRMLAGETTDSAKRAEYLSALEGLLEEGLSNIESSKHFRKLVNAQARIQMLEELAMLDIGRARDSATDAEREKFLASAERKIERLKSEADPASMPVRYTTAQLYAARGDIVAATREAEAAYALKEGASNLQVLRLCAELYTRQSQWGTAREMIRKMLAIDSSDPTLYIGMARVLLNLNQAAEALAYLKPNEPAELRATLEQDRTAISLQIEALRQLKQFKLAEEASRKLGEGSPEDIVRSAQILTWEGKYPEAEQKLLGVLASNPGQESAVRAILQLYEESGRRQEGRQLIDDLIAKFPENRRFKQFRIALHDDLPDDARDQQILDFINEESDEFTRLSALVGYYERRGQLDKATENLNKAEGLKPSDPKVIEAQFTFALRQKDWDKAAKYARKSGELNIDGTMGKIAEGRLALARAAVYRDEGNKTEFANFNNQAIDMIRAGLDAYPNYSQGWTFLAGAYLDAGRVDDAKATLQRALQINPANGYASLFLARIAQSQGDEVAERRYLADASRSIDDDKWLRDRQRYYAERDDPRSGIGSRELAAKEKPDDVENWVVLARLYGDPKVGAIDKAADAYRKALAASSNDIRIAVELANFYGSPEVNQPAEGEKLLKGLFDAESDDAKRARIAVAMGGFYEKQGVLATADRHYRQAAFLDPSIPILSVVADFYSRTGKHREAAEQYEKLVALAADNPDQLRDFKARLIAICLTTGDLDRARAMIDDYLAKYPDDSQGMILEGAYHRVGGDIDKAKAALDAHLAKDPDNAIALWQRGSLYVLLGRWQMAIEDLRKAKALRPDGFNYQHRVALADALIEAGRSDEAISELQLILEANPDQSLVAESLIDAYTRVRPPRFADAENLIYRLQVRFPREPKWPSMLGRIGELAQDWDKAIAGYEKAAEVANYQAQSVRDLFNAYRIANRPQKIVQTATERMSSTLLDRMPEALSTLAWAYAQMRVNEKCYEAFDRALAATQGNFQLYARVINDIVVTLGPEVALERAKEQSDADPRNVGKLQALVHLLKYNERGAEAIEVCDRIKDMATGDADLIFAHLAKGMLLSADKRLTEARDEYETILKLNPDQPLALNNLAYLLGEQLKLPKEALPHAKKAAQLQPNDTNVLDTYGWILFLNEKYGEAAGTLLRAIEIEGDRVPESMKNIDIRYHMGLLYRKQGKPEEAQAMLEVAERLCQTQGRKGDLPNNIKKALEELGQPGGRN